MSTINVYIFDDIAQNAFPQLLLTLQFWLLRKHFKPKWIDDKQNEKKTGNIFEQSVAVSDRT